MNKFLFSLLLLAAPVSGYAEDELTTTETSLTEDAKQPHFEAAIKDKYGLTDEQLKTLHDKGMNNQQITIAAQLATTSGKTLDEVVKMRTEDKMGWGKIAKELGVKPSEIGQSISSMRHELNTKRAEKRDERQNKREERQAKRQQRREEKQNKRAERREKRG